MDSKKTKLRDFFSLDNLRRVNIIRPFLLGNLGLFIIVGFIWFNPIFSSWSNAQVIINSQQQLYNSYTQQIMEYEEHRSLLAAHPEPRILPYDYLTAAMADVQNLAQNYGLRVTTFDSAEPIERYAGANDDSMVELRLTAAFIGERSGEFVYGLANSPAFIRLLRIDMPEYGEPNLRVELSFFGRR